MLIDSQRNVREREEKYHKWWIPKKFVKKTDKNQGGSDPTRNIF